NLAWERQSRETARLHSFIDRFKAKATKAKQAQSRVKALARMEKLAPIPAEAGIDIRIPSPESMPDPLLTLRNVAAGYPPPSSCPQETAQNAPTDASISGDGSDAGIGKVVVKDVTLMVRAGSRIGVLGVN